MSKEQFEEFIKQIKSLTNNQVTELCEIAEAEYLNRMAMNSGYIDMPSYEWVQQ